MSYKGNVTAALGGIAAELGRKGTASDITLYNHKVGDTVLSFAEPTSYPDKIQSLISCLNTADQILYKITEVDPVFAESVVALDAYNIEKGYLILPEQLDASTFKALAEGTVLDSYEVVSEQVVGLREKLAQVIPASDGACVVQVDHSFMVKGVGTVALGVVKSGTVNKYDELRMNPTDKNAYVKSIQVHDTDVPEAVCGVRVGLALKDVKPEDVPRGTLLSKDDSLKTVTELDLQLTVSKYSPRTVKEEDVFLVNSNLNYVPAKVTEGSVEKGETGGVRLALEKPLTIFSERLLLLDPSQKMPRVIGYLTP